MKNAQKTIRFVGFSTLGLATLLGLLFAFFIWGNETAIVFESLESKTQGDLPVYNRVKFVPGESQDLWLMQQSHHGLDSIYTEWDLLAIVVNKTKEPLEASFYQLKPGQLDFDPRNNAPLKARCFACHANGPRALRPKLDSQLAVSLSDRIRIQLWNLRIKTYGKVVGQPGQLVPEGVPFRATQVALQTPLKLKSCEPCHTDHGIRNVLRYEHITTVKFLIRNDSMPPFPWKISDADQIYLKNLTGA